MYIYICDSLIVLSCIFVFHHDPDVHFFLVISQMSCKNCCCVDTNRFSTISLNILCVALKQNIQQNLSEQIFILFRIKRRCLNTVWLQFVSIWCVLPNNIRSNTHPMLIRLHKLVKISDIGMTQQVWCFAKTQFQSFPCIYRAIYLGNIYSELLNLKKKLCVKRMFRSYWNYIFVS